MDVVGTLVGFYSLEITQVTHQRVLVHDAVRAKQVACCAGAIEGDGDVVAFEHGHMRGVESPFVLQARGVECQQLRFRDFGDHVGQLLLH